MANKLFGTADSTLVKASFMHGASNIPKDLSAVYKQREQNVKDFATGINEVFDKIYADDKATNDLLADVSDKSLKLMETGGVVNEYELTQHNGIINDYKQRLKDITAEYGMGKGGDLERSKLRSEMNTYLANSQKDGETLTELTKAAKNNVLLSDVGDNKKELLTLIIQDENNGTNLTKPEYIKGEKYYSLPGTDVKMTMTELAEGFSIRDPKLLSNVNKHITSVVAEPKRTGKDMTEDDVLRSKNKLASMLSDWGEIRNVGQEKFGNMMFTFEEVLTGRAKDANGNIDTDLLGYVYDELERLGGADLDNDGDIDATDKSLLAKARAEGKLYTDIKNGHTLIDAIKKDKQLYRDVMAGYITETAVKDSWGQGLDQFKPKGGTQGKGQINLNPFGKGGGSRIVNADGKSIYIANPERNNRRRSVMNVVNDESGAGTRFVGTLGDYTWDKEAGLWRSGENTYETIDLMKDEMLYFAGGEFEKSLGTSAKDQEDGSNLFSKLTTDDFLGDDDILAPKFNNLLPENSPYSIEAAKIYDGNYVNIKFNGKTVKKIGINNRSAGSEKERQGYLNELIEFFKDKNVGQSLSAQDYIDGK